jgi:hypothetical protein
VTEGHVSLQWVTGRTIPKFVLLQHGMQLTDELKVVRGFFLNQKQRVVLAECGISDAIMDQVQPIIVAQNWYAKSENNNLGVDRYSIFCVEKKVWNSHELRIQVLVGCESLQGRS